MAISIRIPKEISDYREKVILGLSYRKALWGFLAVVVGLSSGVLCYFVLGVTADSACIPALVLSAPLWAIGFIRPMGLDFEVYARLYIQHAIGRNKLPYMTELPKFTVDENFPVSRKPSTAKEKKNYAKSLQKEDRKKYGRESERATGRR